MSGNKFLIFVLIVSLLVSGCAQVKVLNGVTYEPYGIINRKDEKSVDVEYKRKRSSIILSVLFVETIIVPFILIGFRLYEAEKIKDKEK